MSYFENRPALVDVIMDTVLTVQVRDTDTGLMLTLRMDDQIRTGTSRTKEVDISVEDWRAFVRSVNKLVKTL